MSQIPDKIKKKLAEAAPSILFRVEWEVDPYYWRLGKFVPICSIGTKSRRKS